MVMKYSKNAKGAIEFLRWAHKQGELREVVHRAEGLRGRPDQDLGEPRDVEAGPGDGAVRTAPLLQKRLMGYQGQPDKRAAEAWNKFIVTVMYARPAAAPSPRKR
jgi:hypothetical protein